MCKLLVAIAILFSLGASAAAEEKMIVDMSRMTCRELTKLGFQDFCRNYHVAERLLQCKCG